MSLQDDELDKFNEKRRLKGKSKTTVPSVLSLSLHLWFFVLRASCELLPSSIKTHARLVGKTASIPHRRLAGGVHRSKPCVIQMWSNRGICCLPSTGRRVYGAPISSTFACIQAKPLMRTKLSSQCHVPSRLHRRSNGEQIDDGSVGATDFAVISRDCRPTELPAAPHLADHIVDDLSSQNVH